MTGDEGGEDREGSTERGGRGKGAPDVCNLLIEEHSEVISSDGGLMWWGQFAEEKRENRKQLMRVRHGLINFGLIAISLGTSDGRGECRQERLVWRGLMGPWISPTPSQLCVGWWGESVGRLEKDRRGGREAVTLGAREEGEREWRLRRTVIERGRRRGGSKRDREGNWKWWSDICRGVTVGLEEKQFLMNTRSRRLPGLGERTAVKGID